MAEIVVGMAELQEKFRALELSMQRQTLIVAAKAGAEIVRDAMRANAPKGESGRLSAGITMKVSGRESDINEASVDVGPDRKGFYGMFHEFGTKHMRARPFLVDALELNRDRIQSVIVDTLRAAIEKAVK